MNPAVNAADRITLRAATLQDDTLAISVMYLFARYADKRGWSKQKDEYENKSELAFT